MLRRDCSRAPQLSKSVLGVGIDWETAAQAFVRGFEAELGIQFERGEMSESESKRADELVKEKYAHRFMDRANMKKILVYGSYGYTGGLIIEQAIKEGLQLILAGRDEKLLRAQAEKYNLEYRAFSLDNTAALDSALQEVDAVLHCAGPFVLTFRQMAEACIRNKKHYVDISGEIEGFEALAAMDEEAKRAGIMLLPGGGFDVVPSDCLIAYVAGKLPNATHLEIYIKSIGSGVSRGTARSGIENMHRQGRIRRDGKIVSVPNVWDSKQVDFGRGANAIISVGWGDVSTAYHSTGIPNVTAYMGFPAAMVNMMRMTRYIGSVILYPHCKRFYKMVDRKILCTRSFTRTK